MQIKTSFTEEELLKYPELKRKTNLFCLKYILKRMDKGKNALILTYGETGSGKSWVNLRMAELLMFLQGREFNTKERVFNYVTQLAKYSDTKDLPPGDVSVSEELGVSMGARKWQKNVKYSELLQTFRDIKSICFFNVPFRIMADKHARYLVHFEIVMLPREGNKNVTKFFILQKNPSANTESRTIYRKYLRWKAKDYWGTAKLRPIKKIYWRKPSQEVLDIYLPMQKKFKSGVRKGIITKEQEEKAIAKPHKVYGKTNVEELKRLIPLNLKVKDMAKMLGINEDTVTYHIKKIKKVEKDQQIEENPRKFRGVSPFLPRI